MSQRSAVTAETIQQVAALNGVNLSIAQCEALIPGLQAILTVDAQIAAIDLGALTAIGLPWGEEPGDGQH